VPAVLEIVGPTLIVAARETMNARLTSLLVWLLLAGSLVMAFAVASWSTAGS
jgi:hypothetical protein